MQSKHENSEVALDAKQPHTEKIQESRVDNLIPQV
jgi:hypothetical protein